jgi:hypothetical protein
MENDDALNRAGGVKGIGPSLVFVYHTPRYAKYGAIPPLGRIVPMPICVGDALEVRQEGADVDVGQFLGRVGLVPRVE